METLFTILTGICWALQALLALYLLMPLLLLLLHIPAPKGKRLLDRKYPVITDKEFDFAAIITAHQDTRFIPPLVDSFCRQTYSRFMVYVVADDCDISGLHFDDPRICLLRPGKALHAKIKSIKYAVDHFVRPHDALVVFDSDNLVHPQYFEKLDQYFRRGFRAVQTHMLSKNTDSIFAKLDSIGHIYNTFVERQVKMELGLSSSILGLGIAIDTELYRQVMYKDGLGGFDKKLQADMIRTIPQLAFAEDAIVYDEKVDSGQTLEKQRTRWIYTYFKYFAINWDLFMTGWRRGNFNLIFFGFNVLRPPLFITMGLALLFMGLDWLIWPHSALALAWAVILGSFILSFVLIVLTQSRQKGMYKAIFYIPVVVVRQVSALLKIRKASKEFLKTDHVKVVYIDDLLKNGTIQENLL
ncbi:MAG: glycosyltransferase [Bacteroidota bacterium]|nr:glycosyltransferase [Bacteroidota bacterium]MDP4246905.1 glycosyltransferase [Bacteroidota bacterium]